MGSVNTSLGFADKHQNRSIYLMLIFFLLCGKEDEEKWNEEQNKKQK
jgi:hypothetical protein